MKTILKYQGLTLGWALLILMLCTIKLGGISNSPLFFEGFDKLVHCGLFFVFTVLLCNGIVRQNKQSNLTIVQAFVVLLLLLLYSGGIELLQTYVFTRRSGEWADLFADGVGTGMGLFSVLVTLWSYNYEKR